MSKMSFSPPNSGFRVFSACLLSALLTMMPLVQLAAASRRDAGVRRRRPESRKQAVDRGATYSPAKDAFLNAPIPKPAPEPFAVTAAQLKITMDDGLGVGQSKRPEETLTYTATITNTNSTDAATNVVFSNDLTSSANLTFVPGSVQTQPVAINDSYSALGNVQIDVPEASGLIANDRDPDVGNGTLIIPHAT